MRRGRSCEGEGKLKLFVAKFLALEEKREKKKKEKWTSAVGERGAVSKDVRDDVI